MLFKGVKSMIQQSCRGKRNDKYEVFLMHILHYLNTRRLGALRAPTSSWRPFRPLDFVLRAPRALSPVRRARLRSGPVKIWHFCETEAFFENGGFFNIFF